MVTTGRMSRGALMQRLQMLRAQQAAGGRGTARGGPVPGLEGLHFSPDFATAMQKAAASSAQFHSGSLAQMEAHPAVGWSRQQAGIGSADAAIEAIMPRLAESGITRLPDGTWTISGRPSTSGAATSAIQSRVSQMSPATVSRGAVPQPGLGGVPPMSGAAPGAGGPVPVSPGGAPPPRTLPPSTPTTPGVTPGAGGPVPSPGLGGMPSIGTGSGLPSPVAPLQNMAALPPGAVTDPGFAAPPSNRPPSNMPVTQTPPSLDTGFGPVSTQGPPPFSNTDPNAIAPQQPSTGATPYSDVRNPQQSVPLQPPPQASQPPAQTPVRPAALPIMEGGQRLTPPAGGINQNEVPGSAVAQEVPSPGLGGTPPRTTPATPGPATTATVPPGSLPGSTTPSRPGQPPAGFGTSGPPPGFPPGFPFNDRPQMAGLSTLGETIADRVKSRIAGQVSPATPGSPAGQAIGGLGDRIRTMVAQGTGEASRATPGAGGIGLGPATTSIMETVRRQLAQAQLGPALQPSMAAAPGAAPAAVPGAAPSAAPSPPMTGGPTSGAMGTATQQIIRQETGGQDLTGQTNCTIRPQAGCLALNSGIFEVTAQSIGYDFNRIVNDPVYAEQAVNALLTSYATDDASQWGGPAGQSVWEWGNQNLPGGGMEAVARIYFGGEVNGTFIDEQGRSGALYGQQFMEKMAAEGYDPTTAPDPTQTGTVPGAAPSTSVMGSPFPSQMSGAPVAGGYMHPDSQLGQMAANAAAPAGAIGAPSGAIRGDVFGFGTGGNWEDYNTYDPQFGQYGQQFGVDPAVLKGMSIVEGGGAAGTPDNGWGNGMMQVQPEWQAEADRLGLPPINTDEGQIAMSAAILGGQARLGTPANVAPGTIVGVEGDWKANFNEAFFPGGVETRTGSGVTADTYINSVNTLAGDIHAAGGATTPAGQPGVGDVGELGVQIIKGPTLMPGSAVGGLDANGNPVGGAPPTTVGTPGDGGFFGGNSGALIQGGGTVTPTTPVDDGGFFGGNSGAQIAGSVPVTTTGESPASPVNPTPKIPQATGQLELVGNADGMGIAATSASDDSWQTTAFGPATTTSTYYKQPVTWSCTGCGQGCLYNYQCEGAGNGYYGADASTHAAMDILCNTGAGEDCRGSAVNTPVAGTVLCSGGQGEGNYVGCNFATSPEVVDNGGVGQISVNSGTDVNGNMLVMEYWHMQTSNVTPGQVLQPGDLLGGMGSMGGMVHTHLEAQGWCPECNGGQGAMVTLDPTLVANGYYSTHSPSEGYATPATLGPVQQTAAVAGPAYGGGMNQAAPAPGLGGGGYTPAPAPGLGGGGYYTGGQYVAPAPQQALPPPSSYEQSGGAPATTGQVTTDEAGRQYEVRPDGSLRLIYDPAW